MDRSTPDYYQQYLLEQQAAALDRIASSMSDESRDRARQGRIEEFIYQTERRSPPSAIRPTSQHRSKKHWHSGTSSVTWKSRFFDTHYRRPGKQGSL